MSNLQPPPAEPIVVQKYGGSSVADTENLRRVAERIAATRESGKRVVVVVSAMADTTDDLLRKAHEVAKAPSRRELDMLLSCGERSSMALLAMAVHELGHEAVSLTGSQSGIMTNDRHSGARIIEVRPIRVADELARGKIVIVAGFQGVSYKREITTLGRGGSDTTAVAMAAALGAEYCEICSDVEGIYTADPRKVPGAQLLAAIRADEMLELASHGAKVLHAGCVEIAERSDIAIYACATRQDQGGTRIDRIGGGPRTRPVGISGQSALVRLRAQTAGHLVECATKASLPVLHLSSQEGRSELWFSLEDVPDWAGVRATLLANDSITMEEGYGAVSVVGDSIGSDASRIGEVLKVVESKGVAIEALDTGQLRVSVFCARESVDGLVASLHAALIEQEPS
jgi:aspartate kinase